MASSFLANRGIIADEMRKAGYPEVAIFGALARVSRESSFNPNALNRNDAGPGLHSRGLAQWNRDRLSGLQSFANEAGTSWTNARTQARYMVHEFQTTHKFAGDRLKNAKTTEDAVKAMMMYENPKGASKRINGKTVWTPENGSAYDKTLALAGKYAKEGGLDSSVVSMADPYINANVDSKSYNAEKSSQNSVIEAAQAFNNSVAENAGQRDDSTTTSTISDMLKGFMPKANTKPAPAPPSIQELAQAFAPKLQWASL